MAINAGTVMAYMGLDTSEFMAGIKGAGAKLKEMGSSVGNMGKLTTAALTGAGVSAGAILKSSIDIAEGAQKTQANLEQTIKSTGGAAGLTAKEVANMAAGFAKTTTFSKGTIENGQSMLLTFTKIGKDVFPMATQAMLDMSQKMRTDPKEAAIQLGKALSDPVKGVTALTRVGVTFSAQQKEQIKTMVKAGNVAGAQKIILAELNKEFGGQAAAAANTYDGKMKQLTNTINGMKASIGMALIPVLQILLQNITKIIQPIATLIQQNPKLAAGILSIIACTGTLAGGVSIVNKVVGSFGLLGRTITHLGDAFKTMGSMVTKVIGIFPKLISGVSKVIGVFPKLIAGISKVGTVFGGLKKAAGIFKVLPGIINPPVLITIAVIAGLGLIVYEVIKHWDTCKKYAAAFGKAIKDIFASVSDFFSKSIKGWEIAFDEFKNFLSKSVQGWKMIFKNLGADMKAIGKFIFEGLFNGISSMTGKIKNKVASIASSIKNTFKSILGIHSPSTVFTGFGINTGQGYINGLDKMQNPIKNRLVKLANGIKNLGNVRSKLDDIALSGAYGTSEQGLSKLNKFNSSKLLNFDPKITLYVTVADTGEKGTAKLTSEVKSMAKNSLKDGLVGFFMNDVIRD